jgi:tRNA (guanine37-N1)-methyltransferase
MVMRVDVLTGAIEEVVGSKVEGRRSKDEKAKLHRIYLSPRGKRLTQSRVEQLAKKDHLLLLCGHYEGVDQRVIDGWIDEEISIGDYVLTGGELPAMVLIDALARHVPGVLGKEESAAEESFSKSLKRKKEYPHYTRPEEFRGMKVPDVLIGGHHGNIKKWREENLK